MPNLMLHLDAMLRVAGEPSDIAGHLPMLTVLASYVPTYGLIVELGTRSGASTIALLAGARKHTTVLSVDTDGAAGILTREHMARLGLDVGWHEAEWVVLCMDSVEAAESLDAREHVDLLFIDTTHELEQTRRELDAWLPRLRTYGAICGHDYQLGGAGVKQAVDEFADKHADRFSLHVMAGYYGLFVLQPKRK